MKAYTASDRNGYSGYNIVVFAKTAGQAKAYARNSETFCDFEFTDIRVKRCKALDGYYRGDREMDWLNDKDRVAMVEDINNHIIDGYGYNHKWCVEWVKGLPSVQSEIIRCKDCKYARMTYDGECKYCDVWFPDEAEYLDGDYYCASAERKENG